jgi:uncharacterized phage-like protein YoqJ
LDVIAKTACFTGHRTIPSAELPRLAAKLDDVVSELVRQDITVFWSGGAIGFDTLASIAVLRARELNPLIELYIALPCRDQDAQWNESDRDAYRRLLDAADTTVYVSDQS